MIIRGGPLGKAKYYSIRVEFQFRDSPHIRSFLWVPNASTLAENVEFLHSVVCGNLPSEEVDPRLYQLVKTFQIHYH